MFLSCLLFNSDFFLWEMWTRRGKPVCLVILSLIISWCKPLLRNHFIKYSICKLFAVLRNRSMYSVISLTLSALCQSTPNYLKQLRNVSSDLMGEQRLLYRMFQRQPQSSSLALWRSKPEHMEGTQLFLHHFRQRCLYLDLSDSMGMIFPTLSVL